MATTGRAALFVLYILKRQFHRKYVCFFIELTDQDFFKRVFFFVSFFIITPALTKIKECLTQLLCQKCSRTLEIEQSSEKQ